MKLVFTGLVLACFFLILPQALPLVVAQDEASRVHMRVTARVAAEGEAATLRTLSDGDSLGAGDEVQIRVRVVQDAYVYVVAYNAGTRSALLLHPVSGRAEDALLESGEERIVPGPERYLSLRRETGVETFYALATESAPQSLASLLVRMEAAGEDERTVMTTLRQKFLNVAALRVRNLGDQPLTAAGALPQSTTLQAGVVDPQLDVEAMECLYAWLIGKSSGDGSVSASAQNTASASSGCPQVLALSAVEETPAQASASQTQAEPDPAAERTPSPAGGVPAPVATAPIPDVLASSPASGLVIGADDEDDPLETPPSATAPSVASVLPAPDPIESSAVTPSLAPPRGDLMLALAREPDESEPIRSIDVTADGNVSSAVVLVVTPSGTGTGVMVDYAGHVLANWHVVRGYPGVSVSFKAPRGAAPSAKRTRSARVVRISKTADLALLKIENPPSGITPVRMASTNEIRNGDVVHTVGHPVDGDWTYTLGKIEQVKPGSSWYAGHHLLHRGTVIFAELPDDPGGAGAPLFNNRLELVGIGAMPRSIRGLLTGVSAETIRRFLRAPPA